MPLPINIELRQRVLPFQMTTSHQHPEYELYFLKELTGTGEIQIQEHTYPLKKGSLVIINQNISHRTNFAQAKSHERYLIELSPEIFNEQTLPLLSTTPEFFFQQQTGVYELTPSQQAQVAAIFDTLYNESLFKESFYKERQFLRIAELLLLINRFSRQRSLDQNLGLMQQETIQPIVRFVADHVVEPLTLQEVAEKFFLNKSYLARVFKAYTGQTMQDFINSKRVFLAQRALILYPELTLKEIAKNCGFFSEAHLGKTFKRYTGLTPKRFIKNHGN